MSGLSLRRAGPGDAKSIRELTRLAYSKWVPVIGREPKPMRADYDVAVRNHWIDLYEPDGWLAALVEMIPHSDHLLIENLAVSPLYQGRGIGNRLLEHVAEAARQEGLNQLRLYTNAAFEENVAFYLKRGFLIDRSESIATGGRILHMSKVL